MRLRHYCITFLPVSLALGLRWNMEAIFDVNGKPFKVEFTALGSEKYYYDNQLLLKRRSLKTRGKVPFELDGNKVEIDVEISAENFEAKAYVNGKLAVAELFPEIKQRLANRKQNAKSQYFVKLVVWVVLAVVFMFIFQLAK